MANKDLHNKPHHINAGQWWYEEPRGISVVVNQATETKFCEHIVEISWRSIRAALKRKDKKDED